MIVRLVEADVLPGGPLDLVPFPPVPRERPAFGLGLGLVGGIPHKGGELPAGDLAPADVEVLSDPDLVLRALVAMAAVLARRRAAHQELPRADAHEPHRDPTAEVKRELLFRRGAAGAEQAERPRDRKEHRPPRGASLALAPYPGFPG